MAASTSKQPPDKETKIQPLLFKALATNGTNYLEWSIDVKSHLSAEGLETMLNSSTLTNIPATSRWKAMVILRKYLHTSLRLQYI